MDGMSRTGCTCLRCVREGLALAGKFTVSKEGPHLILRTNSKRAGRDSKDTSEGNRSVRFPVGRSCPPATCSRVRQRPGACRKSTLYLPAGDHTCFG